MRLLGVLLVHVLSSPVVASTVQIQGVAPRDQGKYAGTDFTCLVDGKAATLPSRRVNDNFCDCDDGDDEPGTAACSHVLSSQFYCANEGFFPETIPTSRIQDGVCDCCDGSDEQLNSKSLCPNTCAHAAEEFRKKAEQRLDVVRRGFETRQAILNGDVATFFEKEEASKATIEKELVALKLLKSRVTVHKDREELREEKYRFEHARREHAESHKDEQTSDQESPHAINENAAEATAFEPLDSITVADDDVDVDRAEDERAAEVLDSYRETVKSQIELLDGTKVSLADYLRMDHRQAATKIVFGIDLHSGYSSS
ncbi:hypothetical protein PsorP6_000624 [Peronosclerospora sorghi]|uniref:Uncharacterized protein n=1 Tax=Peronosclerospora sorghi TaxID=230839 RepID=A0ACC0WU81_9STRA|nr:hypothetical protein PsorP6_000624 [Peronosclerospora sorghi]